jgi:hypothetical protein
MAGLMGGAPRQRRAAAFPPDYYWCLLDELPLHLVPAGSLPWAHFGARRRFLLNPLARILPAGQVPEELAGSPALLERFALQGVIAWIPRSEGDSLLPFWLSPQLEATLAAAIADGGFSSRGSDEGLFVLTAAGLLQTEKQAHRERQHWHQVITTSAEMFQQQGYAYVRNLIHPFHLAALRRYFRYMIRRGLIGFGDEQCERRYGIHNDRVARFFHHYLAHTVSAVVGEATKPSYVFSASYVEGAELKKHIDREQCEFSVTLCLDFSPEPEKETSWPIHLDTQHGPVSIYQALGDGLVYRGTRVPHYRDPLSQGRTSTSIFFHYVRQGFTGSLD